MSRDAGLCVEVQEADARAPARRPACVIGTHLIFKPDVLRSYCFGCWDQRVFDAFVVAAATEFCDGLRSRPPVSWVRRFDLRIPVHDPDRWRSEDVSSPLIRALSLLTGDQWNIRFTGRRHEEACPQGILGFSQNAKAVVPYSEGLDSYMVARLEADGSGIEPIRVRLGTRNISRTASETPFVAVPYEVRYAPGRRTESSARSRGFRFALLGGTAAYLASTDTVIMPESGQGALGPSLVPVGQQPPDQRTHPSFLRLMEEFLAALLGYEIRYVQPRLWNTKGETLRDLLGAQVIGDTWRDTRSCWQDQRHVSVSRKKRQCGVCAACMLRRMSVHAAGATEDREIYVWEDLRAHNYEDGAAPAFKKRAPRGSHHQYALAGTLHLEDLAQLARLPRESPKLDLHVWHLRQSLGLAPEEARDRLHRMLMRHAQEWADFLQDLGADSFVTKWVAQVRDAHA